MDIAFDQSGFIKTKPFCRQNNMKYPHENLIPFKIFNSAMQTSFKFTSIWKRIIALYPKGIAYDIGAHCGVYGLQLQNLGFNVHVFEPSSYYHKVLDKMFDNVHKVAISNKNETLMSELNDCTCAGATSYESQLIRFVKLDDYIQDLPKPNFIKMDIEGMETLAFHGMSNILKTHPIIQLEYHSKSLKYKGKNYPGFLSPAEGGFDFELLEDYMFFNYKLKPSVMDRHNNFFLIPKHNKLIKSFL